MISEARRYFTTVEKCLQNSGEKNSSRLLYIVKRKICNRIFMTHTHCPEATRMLALHLDKAQGRKRKTGNAGIQVSNRKEGKKFCRWQQSCRSRRQPILNNQEDGEILAGCFQGRGWGVKITNLMCWMYWESFLFLAVWGWS